jgi:hypothetical protein
MNILYYGQIVLISLTLLTVSICGQKAVQNEEINPGIVESVFRYQIAKCAENTSVAVFLLSVQGKDPSDEVMKRFAHEAAWVKKKSSLGKFEATNEYIDKESGKFAVLLSIDKLNLMEENQAEVAGSCGYADFAARGYKYSLVREEKGWIVRRAEPTWVW